MFKFLAIFVILAVTVGAYPSLQEVPAEAPKALSPDGQGDLAGAAASVDLEAGDATDASDLKGSETFGFGYYPVYGRGYGYGRYGGWGGGWGYGGYGGGYGGWGGYRRRGWGGYW